MQTKMRKRIILWIKMNNEINFIQRFFSKKNSEIKANYYFIEYFEYFYDKISIFYLNRKILLTRVNPIN